MLKKHSFDQDPIKQYRLEKKRARQLRNGNMVWHWEQMQYHACAGSHIGKTIFVLSGSIHYQKLSEKTEINKEQSIQVNAGAYIHLPKGDYYIWVAKEGAEVVYYYDTIPMEFIESMNLTNIDV